MKKKKKNAPIEFLERWAGEDELTRVKINSQEKQRRARAFSSIPGGARIKKTKNTHIWAIDDGAPIKKNIGIIDAHAVTT